MNRAQRRAAAKQAKKEGNPDLEEKMTLFGKLPDECLTCLKPFDKKDREMVMSWHVVERRAEQVVNLYCPECWEKANKLIEDIQNDIRNRSERGGEGSEQSESE